MTRIFRESIVKYALTILMLACSGWSQSGPDRNLYVAEGERLQNRLATTREDHRRWRSSSPETLKRLAISVFRRRSFLSSSIASA